jgi:putative flippase GtrA
MISNSITNDKEGILRWKRYTKEFSKYTIVGIFATFSNIFFIWLLIDILKVNTLLSTSVVVIGIFIIKFIAYNKINLIRQQFVKYTVIQVSMRLLQIAGIWYFIDVLNLPTIFSSVFVMGVIFLLTFVVFKVTNLTNN